MPSPTPRQVRDLCELFVEIAREECPEDMRSFLVCSNLSTRSKFLMTAKCGKYFIARSESKALSLIVSAAQGCVSPLVANGGYVMADKVREFLVPIFRSRFATAYTQWKAQEPVRHIEGVETFYEKDGSVTLTLHGLQPGAVKRMVEVLAPLMHLSRFQRDPPV